MSRTQFVGKYYTVSHTIEEKGPHPTVKEDHYDRDFSITAVLKGSGVCYIESAGYPISDGNLFAIGTDELHSYHFEQTGFHERVSIYFSSSILSPVWEYELPLMSIFTGHVPGNGNCFLCREHGEIADEILPQMKDLCDALAAQASPMDEAKMHVLVLRLLFDLYAIRENQSMQGVETRLVQDPVISVICRYIHEHPEGDLTYQALQDRFHVSRYCLSEIFRRCTGMSLTKYVLDKRIMRATALIRQGCSFSAAAELAGFSSYSHFYREFVKCRGMSPRTYFCGDRSLGT